MTPAARLPDPAADRAEASHQTKGLLRLTMACNERCPFCNVPVEDYPRPTPPDEEIEAQLQAFLASGEQTLTISGGEPTLLRRRLLALVARARGAGVPFVELQTNAVLIDPGYAAELAAAGLTSAFVSLLSHQSEHHDTLAGLPGAFPRCLAGIDALLAVGVRVTLNPVIARLSQEGVADYVDFVADRLPGVRSISLSAVQPHGRAAADPDLLPDYGRLALSVRRARARARAHGIELLNPYCGLPLCIGWEDGLETSVEAIEASLGGWSDRPGIENAGDKRQGEPCRGCALRTRCGGAWHAVWERAGERGTGLAAPVALRPPWLPGAETRPGQCVDRPPEPGEYTVWKRLHAPLPPVEELWAGPWTDLALEVSGASLDPQGQPDRALLAWLRRADRANRGLGDAMRRRVWLHLDEASAQRAGRVLPLCRALGVHAVELRGASRAHLRALDALVPGLLWSEPNRDS